MSVELEPHHLKIFFAVAPQRCYTYLLLDMDIHHLPIYPSLRMHLCLIVQLIWITPISNLKIFLGSEQASPPQTIAQ